MSFDPNKPYNDLPILPPKFNFDDLEILKKYEHNWANLKVIVLPVS